LLGGIIAANAGWRWIFWFLSIASGFCLFLMIFFLPETARNIVGDGSLRPKTMGQLPFPRFCGLYSGQVAPQPHSEEIQPSAVVLRPLRSLYALLRKDTAINVFCIGIWYATWTCIQACLSTVFTRVYQISQLQAGLIYIPFGVGVCISAYLTGYLNLILKFYELTRANRSTSEQRLPPRSQISWIRRRQNPQSRHQRFPDRGS
jgi:predicted MFS family arabinose efflux permease